MRDVWRAGAQLAARVGHAGGHPSPSSLQCYLDGELDRRRAQAVGAHLLRCLRCRGRMTHYRALRQAMAAAPICPPVMARAVAVTAQLLGDPPAARASGVQP